MMKLIHYSLCTMDTTHCYTECEWYWRIDAALWLILSHNNSILWMADKAGWTWQHIHIQTSDVCKENPISIRSLHWIIVLQAVVGTSNRVQFYSDNSSMKIHLILKRMRNIQSSSKQDCVNCSFNSDGDGWEWIILNDHHTC